VSLSGALRSGCLWGACCCWVEFALLRFALLEEVADHRPARPAPCSPRSETAARRSSTSAPRAQTSTLTGRTSGTTSDDGVPFKGVKGERVEQSGRRGGRRHVGGARPAARTQFGRESRWRVVAAATSARDEARRDRAGVQPGARRAAPPPPPARPPHRCRSLRRATASPTCARRSPRSPTPASARRVSRASTRARPRTSSTSRPSSTPPRSSSRPSRRSRSSRRSRRPRPRSGGARAGAASARARSTWTLFSTRATRSPRASG
jgi:hypothetical protein